MKVQGINKAVYGFLQQIQAECWIALFGIIITAVAWGSVIHRMAHERTDQITDIYDLNNGLASALEEHVSRVLKSADDILLRMKMEYEDEGGLTNHLVAYVRRVKADPLYNQAAIANSDGDLLLSAVPLKKPISIANRRHFTEQKANPDAGLVIAEPVNSPVSGKWSVFLSRRLNRKDGSFDGVVCVGLDPGYFSDFYSVPELGRDRSIIVVGLDRVVLARYFQNDFQVGQDMGASPLFSAVRKSPVGHYEGAIAIDGPPMFVSYRKMGDYPLIVMVTSLKSSALSALEKRKKGYYASALAFTLFTVAFCLLLIRTERQARSGKVLLIEELKERKRAEELLRESERNLLVKDRINKIFLTVEGDEVYDELLKYILEFSESEYGIFGYLNENGKFVAPAQTREIFWEECTVAGKEEMFNKGGFFSSWKRALEERTTLIFNEGPFKVPQGHLPIYNTMVAPVFLGKYFICITQIANKPSGYTEEDRALLDSIADQIAPVLNARIQRDRQEKERRKVEEFLRISESSYRELFGAITDALLVHEFHPEGLPGRFIEVNDVACRRLGYTREELLMMTPVDIDASDSDVDVIGITRQLGKGETVTFEQRHVAKDGRRIPVEITVRLFNLHHKPAVLAMVRDITARKQAENALHESEERYRALFEKSPDGVLIIDADCRFVEFNAATYEQLGYSKGEFAALSLHDICPFQTSEEGNIRMAELMRKGFDQYEVKHSTKNGEIRDIFVVAQTISMAGQAFIYMIWRDITDRKRTEQDIINYQKRLRALMYESSLIEERERKRIADELHDTIGQNLVFSKLRLSSLRDNLVTAGETETLEEIIGMIDSTIQYSRSLTHELGNPVLYLVGFEAAVRWLAEQLGKTQNIQVDVNIKGNLADIQMEMRVLLYKTLRELLFNVVKHAQADYVNINIRRVSGKLEIDVMDNGVGIGPLSTTGYGLISVTERITYLGGTMEIGLNTDMGTGSRVSIAVPLPQNGVEVTLQ